MIAAIVIPFAALSDTTPTLVLGDTVTMQLVLGDPPRVRFFADPEHMVELREVLWRLGVIPPPPRPFYREFREEP